jgi:hypothetical protein
MYLAYLDDSGDTVNHDVMAGLIVPLSDWATCLKVWLDWRRFLFRRWGIPADFELHAQEFLRPKKHPVPTNHPRAHKVATSRINDQVGQRHEVYRRSLETLSYMPRARAVAVCCHAQDRLETYRRLLSTLHDIVEAEDTRTLVMVDGFDTRFRKEHRSLELETRCVFEDPWHEYSHESQFLQIADLIAHAAFQHVARQESRKFMWDWYPNQLSKIRVDLGGGCACGMASH